MFNRLEVYEKAFEKYAKRFYKMKKVARLHGYALTVHGSMRRDLDIVAVPWVEDASDSEILLKDLVIAAEGVLQVEPCTTKPHGIKSYNILIMGHLYIDLNIIPLLHHDEKVVKK